MRRFAFDEQVAGQADAVSRALDCPGIPALNPDRPVMFSGIGTSLHACRVAAYWVAELSLGRIRPVAVESHELALHGRLTPQDQLVVVSHRGTKRFPRDLLARAQAAGATTVTVTGLGSANPGGDHVLRTGPDERAGTHSVSYLTALAVLGRVVARLLDHGEFSRALDGIPGSIRETLAVPAPVEILSRLLNREPLLITGYGIDEITADEAALKIKEGCYLYAEGMSEELALHGTPAAFDPRLGAILIKPGRDDGGRERDLATLLRQLGVEVLEAGPNAADLPCAEVEYLLRPFVAIIPIQRLVAELARRRGSNPDLIRGDVEPWASAIHQVRL